MRKLPAAAQEERRRQVIGLRQAGMTYDAIAALVGLTRTGVFNISDVRRQHLPAWWGSLRQTCEADRSVWLLRSAGGRAAETTVSRL